VQAVSARDRKIASACDSRGVSMQLLWCNFDRQASISFWWSAGEWDGRCYSRTKDDICHVRTIYCSSHGCCLTFFLSRFAVRPWLASSLRPVAVSSLSATLVYNLNLIVVTPTDTLLRAIGKRANALHVNAYFSSQCVLISALGYASRLSLLPY
jgi:hypothetical protein